VTIRSAAVSLAPQIAQGGVPANSAAHNRTSATQNSPATAAPSNPATQPTSQSSGASSEQADSQPSAFMAALMSAALDDSSNNLPAKPLAKAGSNWTTTTGRRLNALKQPSRNGNQEAAAVAVPASLTIQTILPLRFSLPSRDPEQDGTSDGAFSGTAGLQGGNADSEAAAGASSHTGAPADSATEPAKRTADAAPAAGSQANSAEDLSFAARVQPAKPVSESGSAQPQPDETAAPAVKRATTSASSSTAAPSAANASTDAPSAVPSSSSTALAAGALAAFRQTDQIAAAPQTVATPSSRLVEAVAPVVAKPAATPLQDISLQVGPAGAQKVEIRMVQQSGELQVAVRTGDSDLSHGLQQGLSDLVGRLQESGFRAEAWRPGGPDPHSATVLETKSSSESSQSGDSQAGNSGSRQESGQRQQNPSRRPAWVDELEGRMNNQNPTGESYGIRN
jgi:hypothetical protein